MQEPCWLEEFKDTAEGNVFEQVCMYSNQVISGMTQVMQGMNEILSVVDKMVNMILKLKNAEITSQVVKSKDFQSHVELLKIQMS